MFPNISKHTGLSLSLICFLLDFFLLANVDAKDYGSNTIILLIKIISS